MTTTSRTSSTTHRRSTGSSAARSKSAGGDAFGRIMGNVEDIVDSVSRRLWEMTR